MFLELPKEIRHRIYDMLEADDRVRLNMALPTGYKIGTTINTNANKTRKIGLVAYMLKRTRPDKLSPAVAKLVLDNLADPTAARIADEYKLTQMGRNIIYLLSDIRSGKVKQENVARYPLAKDMAYSMDIFDFVDALSEYGNGCLFEDLYDLGYIVDPIMIDYSMLTRMFINIVNLGNTEFLKYLVSRRGELVGVEDGCKYLTCEIVLDMFKDNLWIIEMLDEVVGIPDPEKKYLLKSYIEELNFEATHYMYRVKGVRL